MHLAGTALGLALLGSLLGAEPFSEGGLAPAVTGSVALLALAVVPGQAFLGLWALGLARRDPGGPVRALGLLPPRASGSDLLLLVLAMPAATLAGSLLARGLFPELESATLEEIQRWLASAEGWPRVLAIGALLSLVPALAEELFFRGWLQRRLVQALGPTGGILLASLAFAGMHGDLVQGVAVLPGGLLLGYLAWRTGSLWSAVLGHAAFNALGVVVARIAPKDLESIEAVGPGLAAVGAVMLASPLALAFLVFQLERRRRVAGTGE